jgi:hypothetical protein
MTHDRFDELYERYSDGGLSDAERAEFERLLEDPSCRARLVEVSSYEAAVTEELRLAGTSVAKDEPLAPPDSKSSSRSWPKVGSRRIPIQRPAEIDETRVLTTVGFAAAAAGLIILVLIFVTSPRNHEAPPIVVRPMPDPSTAPRDVPAVGLPKAAVEAVTAPKTPAVEDPLTPRRFEPAPSPKETSRETPKPGPPKAPKAPEKPSVAPPKPDDPRRESATFVATVERVAGEVLLGTETAEAGKGIASGRTLTTGPAGYASLKYPDGTRVELSADTTLSKLVDGPAGKSAQLEQGMIFVDAAKQPAGRPLVITTAQAESSVIGTQFVLTATPVFTRIDVREGRVKFTRLPQAVSSVVVKEGHYAIAGPTGELVAKPGTGLWKAPPAGLQMWLRADAGVKVNGGTVSAWLDQSPSGNSAVQDKPAAQPKLLPNAFSGKPALKFDGVDNSFVLPDGFGDFRAGLTAFVVVRPAPGGAFARFIDLDVGPTCDNIVFGRKDTPDKLGFWVYSNSLTRGKVEAPGAVVANEVQSFCALLNPGGHATLYKNGGAVAAGDTSTPKYTIRKPNSIAKSNSGGSDPLFKGEMYEILLYNRALSEAERVYVESYLYARYFDPTTPPASLRSTDR